MPRIARVSVADTFYHVLNRANGRLRIFNSDDDYRFFESLLAEAKDFFNMRIYTYCIMPNHWHLLLRPRNNSDMGEFMHWVTTTHVRTYRTLTRTIGEGHLYQGAYKSFPVDSDQYLRTLVTYIEQNPLRAHLVNRAEEWKWSGLWRRTFGSPKQRDLLEALPFDLPADYLLRVNTLQDEEVLESVRRSIAKGTPYGREEWVQEMVERHGMQSTMREPGRPRGV